MKHLISFILLSVLVFTPIFVFADHSYGHTLEQIQEQLAMLQKIVNALLAAVATPAQPSQGTGTAAQPAVPAKKAIPSQPVTPATPAIPTQPAQPAIPSTGSGQAVQPYPGTGTPATPVTPTQPYPGTGQPAAPAQSTTSTQPVQPVTPTTPATAPQEATPGQPIGAQTKPAAPMSPEIQAARKTTLENIQKNIDTLQAKVSELKSQIQVRATTPVVPQAIAQVELKLTRALQRGSSGDDVKQVQGFLKLYPALFPDGQVTGYFGPLTEKAIKKFQEKNGIGSVGIVGPKTRAKIKERGATRAIPAQVFPGEGIPAIPATPAVPSQVQDSGKKDPPVLEGVFYPETASNSDNWVYGTGFDRRNNTINWDGVPLAENLSLGKGRDLLQLDVDGDGDLEDILPFRVPEAESDSVHTVSVTTRYGTSNTVTVKIVEPVSYEARPNPSVWAIYGEGGQPIESAPIGGKVMLIGEGFTPTDNLIEFAYPGLGFAWSPVIYDSIDGNRIIITIPDHVMTPFSCNPVAPLPWCPGTTQEVSLGDNDVYRIYVTNANGFGWNGRLLIVGNTVPTHLNWTNKRITNAFGNSVEPFITPTGEGYTLAWADGRNGGEAEIFLARLDRFGEKITEDIKVSLNPAMVSANPKILRSGNDETHLIWEEYSKSESVNTSDGCGLIYATVKGDGVSIETKRIVTDNYGTCPRDVAFAWRSDPVTAQSNGYMIAWKESRANTGPEQLFVAALDLTGNKVSGDIQLTAATKGDRGSLAIGGIHYTYETIQGKIQQILVLPIYWQDSRGGNNEIYVTKVDMNGSKIGSENLLTATAGSSEHPELYGSYRYAEGSTLFRSDYGATTATHAYVVDLDNELQRATSDAIFWSTESQKIDALKPTFVSMPTHYESRYYISWFGNDAVHHLFWNKDNTVIDLVRFGYDYKDYPEIQFSVTEEPIRRISTGSGQVNGLGIARQWNVLGAVWSDTRDTNGGGEIYFASGF